MPTKVAIYFGWTPKGKKIHLGDATSAWLGDSKIRVVDTFCGCVMRAWEDGSMPPPGQVREFCRNCFRSLAWEIFEKQMLKRRA